MNCSMSMSSLSTSSKCQKTPDASKWNETHRQFNSLSSKKSRRTLEKKLNRRSWVSMEEMSQEDLWKSCLQPAQDAWKLDKWQAQVREFLEDYSRICDWLNSVQVKRSRLSNPDGLSQLAEDMQLNQHWQQEMNERGRILAQTLPKLKKEFEWRIRHMNSQWNSLEKILLCQSSNSYGEHGQATSDTKTPEDCDIHWMSRWLREMESELQPLAFNVHWTHGKLVKEMNRHQELQTKVDSKATIVHGAVRQARIHGQLSKKRVDILERRWIQLRLRILEWVEHLGRISAREARKKVRGRLDFDCVDFKSSNGFSDDDVNEPLSKYRRLGSNPPETESLNVDAAQDQIMGQGHEVVGSVYQTGSPVSNSVIELSLGEVSPTESLVGHKRKLGSCIPQVVPTSSSVQMNISTYYFKHSDTEAEGSHNRQEEQDGDSQHQNLGHPRSPSRRENSRKWDCQRNLDFGQDDNIFLLNENCTVGLLSEELVAGLEEMDQDTSLALQGLDEIEELVEKAELLVKVGRKRHRNRMDLESWGIKMDVGNEEEESTIVCPCRLDPEEVGAVGGFCSCGTAGMTKSSKCVGAKPKRHSRVRQWVRAHNHNSSILKEQKSTSSCDASGESASESESELTDGSNEEPQLSSDDPTILTASTTLLVQQSQSQTTTSGGLLAPCSPKRGSSLTSDQKQTSGGGDDTGVVLRHKKFTTASPDLGTKPRPKSFTEANPNTPGGYGGWDRSRFKALSPIHDGTYKSVFVSDPVLNADHTRTESGERDFDIFAVLESSPLSRRKSKFRTRRLSKQKKRESLDVDLEDELDQFTSNSILGGGFAEMEHQLEDIENTLPSNNSSPPLKPQFKLDPIDTGSLITDVPNNDQDWDSYQEKYLSEPYSEEPFDADRTLKLLAFGEDYDQVLDRAESESSSLLSGFQMQEEPGRKRRPFTTREDMESDSDREEFNHFLIQSVAQLRYIDSVFRKHIETANLQMLETPSEYAEMEATCEENMNSLKLILCSVEKPGVLPFDIDVKSIQDVLNSWDLLRGRITNAAKLKQIHDDLKYLRVNFESIHRDLTLVDPFDSKDLSGLKIKIDRIQSILSELTTKRRKLQAVNEDSVGTQIYLKEASVDVRRQLKNLYALYEENLQVGSYLLDKMRFLEEAWSNFEQERDSFEKSLVVTPGISGGLVVKGKKSLSSGASTDSGHGTDFSYSDSDIDEKRQKLVALRKRALDLKAFLPPGSPVLDVIDSKINEAQKDFEMIEKVGAAPLNLKLIFPKRKSPVSISRKSSHHRSSKSPSKPSLLAGRRHRSCSPTKSLRRDPSRHWRALRFSLTFHLALMGLFAVAWFLQPRCCENMNTFEFSLVPHLAHDRVPHI